jgi:hypothetical protein
LAVAGVRLLTASARGAPAVGFLVPAGLCFDTPGSCSHEKATVPPPGLDAVVAASGFMPPPPPSEFNSRQQES